jgi:hypothetical protein
MPQRLSGGFEKDRKHSPLPEFEFWDRPVQRIFCRPTAPVFVKKSVVKKVSNLLVNVCCDH